MQGVGRCGRRATLFGKPSLAAGLNASRTHVTAESQCAPKKGIVSWVMLSSSSWLFVELIKMAVSWHSCRLYIAFEKTCFILTAKIEKQQST